MTVGTLVGRGHWLGRDARGEAAVGVGTPVGPGTPVGLGMTVGTLVGPGHRWNWGHWWGQGHWWGGTGGIGDTGGMGTLLGSGRRWDLGTPMGLGDMHQCSVSPRAGASLWGSGRGVSPQCRPPPPGGVWLRLPGCAALPGHQGRRALLPGGPRGQPGGAGPGHQHPQGLRRDGRARWGAPPLPVSPPVPVSPRPCHGRSRPPLPSLPVHVSYLDGKGNLEPQGAGEEWRGAMEGGGFTPWWS